jgi:hypothetical protein
LYYFVVRYLLIILLSYSLTATGNYTRVAFPACDVGKESSGSCDFDVHQLSKLMWSKLETHAPEAYHVVSNMRFSQSQYEDVLRIYVSKSPDFSNSPVHYEDAACSWIRANTKVWEKWLPPNLSNKTVIFLGGMFPLSGPFWRQPGLVPGKYNMFVAHYYISLKQPL